jgi:hypothetical protein
MSGDHDFHQMRRGNKVPLKYVQNVKRHLLTLGQAMSAIWLEQSTTQLMPDPNSAVPCGGQLPGNGIEPTRAYSFF